MAKRRSLLASGPARPTGSEGNGGGGREYLCGSLMSTSVRLAYGLGPLIQTLEERDIAVAPLLEAAEIAQFALEEPSYRIRLEQESSFTRLALRHLDLSEAGLVVGRKYHLTMFGILGLASSCAATTLEMLRLILSYPVLAWGMFETSAWRNIAHCFVTMDEGTDVARLKECTPFFIERDMTCVVTLFRDALGRPITPEAVRFRHSAPPDPSPYATFFGCEVLFGQAANEVKFEAGFWDEPLPQANDMSRRFFENQCRRISETLTKPLDYADIVRSRLESTTPIPSLPKLAGALHLTERTVQRRLAAEDTSFSAVLREVRIRRAYEYLRHSNLTLEDIADRLGFKDVVAFSHAFKDWTRAPPSEIRRAPQNK